MSFGQTLCCGGPPCRIQNFRIGKVMANTVDVGFDSEKSRHQLTQKTGRTRMYFLKGTNLVSYFRELFGFEGVLNVFGFKVRKYVYELQSRVVFKECRTHRASVLSVKKVSRDKCEN
ncbi:MAG: hypothetical protein EBR09_01055 [Proteobacteria bacterium]|nr:hypothetical protein [Pseudomonadota bacterium]